MGIEDKYSVKTLAGGRASNHDLVEVRIHEALSGVRVAECYTSLPCDRKVLGPNPGGCVLPMVPKLG